MNSNETEQTEYFPRDEWVLHRQPNGVIAIADHSYKGYLKWRNLEDSDFDLLERFLASENSKGVVINPVDQSAVTELQSPSSD